MVTFKKQSLVDYEVLVNGKHHSWIRKYSASHNLYIWDLEAEFFNKLSDVKKFITTQLAD